MKTFKKVMFIIVGTLITLYSFAQQLKEEKKVKIRMEVIDNQGNEKIIDTTFVAEPSTDISKIVKEIKEKSGLSKDNFAEAKSEMELDSKYVFIDKNELFKNFNPDSLHQQIMILHKNRFAENSKLQEAFDDLRSEIERMKMNEEALNKLEKAMEELHRINRFGNDESMDMEKMFSTHPNMPKIWINKEGDSLKMNMEANTFFFGTDEDIKIIEGIGGDKNIIIKKIPKEAMKGGAVFMSDDATEIKEFHDENGNVKIIRYEVKKNESDQQNIEVVMGVDADSKDKKEIVKSINVTTSSMEKEMEKAKDKGLIAKDSEPLNLKMFNVNSTEEKTTVGTHFENKGKVNLQVLDKEMNKIWEKNGGKISGDWSVTIPSEILKPAGMYYLLFTQDNKSKLFKFMGR
jgi:hypothetical protein